MENLPNITHMSINTNASSCEEEIQYHDQKINNLIKCVVPLHKNEDGYDYIGFSGKYYKANELIYYLIKGEIPDHYIDLRAHIKISDPPNRAIKTKKYIMKNSLNSPKKIIRSVCSSCGHPILPCLQEKNKNIIPGIVPWYENKDGYNCIGFNGQEYLVVDLLYYLIEGEMPEQYIDIRVVVSFCEAAKSTEK